MRLLVPKDVTADTILATNLTEDAPPWDGDTAYAVGAVVRQDDTHRRYKALLASNAGKLPADNCAGTAPVWSDVGVCNNWAPFDGAINTVAVGTASNATIDVTLASSRCDTVAIFGLADAAAVDLEMRDSFGAVVHSGTMPLEKFEIVNWYQYFFAEFKYRRDLTQALPMYGTSSLRLVIHGVGAIKPKVGTILPCRAHALGRTLYANSDFGFTDYSTDDEDKWGRTDLEQGPTAKSAAIDVRVDTDDFDYVVGLIESVRGRLAVWDCNNLAPQQQIPFERAIILGRVRDFKPPVEGPTITTFSLEIRGVP